MTVNQILGTLIRNQRMSQLKRENVKLFLKSVDDEILESRKLNVNKRLYCV